MKTKTAAVLGIESLYHYQPFDKPERFARIFTEGTIYLSNPKEFNDPWDCRPCFSKSALDNPEQYEQTVQWFVRHGRKRTSFSEEEYLRHEQELRANRKLLEWFIDQMTADMEQAIQTQYRVYCLSIHPDSALMWSHYADSHKGLCLEFSVRNELFCGALPVQYLDSYPPFDVADRDEDAHLQPLLAKSAAWSYEDEFRVVAAELPYEFAEVLSTKNGFLRFPEGTLRSVIVGALMPPPERDLVRSLVTESGWHVALKEAARIPDRYALEIRLLQ